jgi:hypothetical protein
MPTHGAITIADSCAMNNQDFISQLIEFHIGIDYLCEETKLKFTCTLVGPIDLYC